MRPLLCRCATPPDPGSSRPGAGRDSTADPLNAPENMRSEGVLAIIRRDNSPEGVFKMPFRKHPWHDDVELRQNDTADDDADDDEDLEADDADDAEDSEEDDEDE